MKKMVALGVLLTSALFCIGFLLIPMLLEYIFGVVMEMWLRVLMGWTIVLFVSCLIWRKE